ncbi:MAG TPA: hypothetical protein VGM90_22185 [Kofleriaceae bacterium]|jgi:hypothetical protein
MARDGSPGDADSNVVDSPPHDPCWGTPQNITAFQGEVVGEPTMSTNQLVAMWADYSNVTNKWRIRWAHRSLATGPWMVENAEPFASTSDSDPDPSLDDAGGDVVFRFGPTTAPRVYEAIYNKVTMTWSVGPVRAPIIAAVDVAGVDLSGDGLFLYYTDTSDTMRALARATIDDNFVDAFSFSLAGHARLPSVSPDGLTVYFDGGGAGILKYTRTATDASFATDPETVIASNGQGVKDPDILGDGHTMIIGWQSTSAALVHDTCQ